MGFQFNIYYGIGAGLILLGLIGFIIVTATSKKSKRKLVDKLSKEY